MTSMKTPGVYIVEKNAFPNSVVEVATAVPAFIGYTQKADNGGDSLAGKPWKITSMAEFRNYFGDAYRPKFKVTPLTPSDAPSDSDDAPEAVAPATADQPVSLSYKNKTYLVEWGDTKKQHILYYAMMMFFQNGGGPCYIVSVGNYDAEVAGADLKKGIDSLIKEQEPTMIVVPEAVTLDSAQFTSVVESSLKHCGSEMKNRVAILDVFKGYRDRQDPTEQETDARFLGQGGAKDDCIENFRLYAGSNFLDFGVSYYPWVNASVVVDADLDYENFTNPDIIKNLIIEDIGLPSEPPTIVQIAAETDLEKKNAMKSHKLIWDELAQIIDPNTPEANKVQIRKILRNASTLYDKLLKVVAKSMNLLPPSSAMAGVYTMVDNSRGVWKAPANVSMNAVVTPNVNITHYDQEDLNVHTQGKSINAIRSFIGEGTLVWGARTLDGNSLDWRYVNVRRTMIMLEESIRLSIKAFVFEDNVAKTWVTIKSTIQNFLTGIWKRGGLAGSSPSEAFNVQVGLGETMTPIDILEGRMNITVLVAVTRPAEFIVITFQQKMQES